MFYFEILPILLLILFNGLLAMSEFAIISSRKSRLDQMANQGKTGARSALGLKEDPGRFLSTVQIGITLVGIFAGAFSGATLGSRLGVWLNSFPEISPYGNALGIGVTVIIITYLSLVLGELAPKRIALARPEQIASFVSRPMKGLSLAAAPLVWVLHLSSEAVLRLLALSGTKETTVTEEEVKYLVAEATTAGVFVPKEKEMIEGVLRLADRPVRIIMTPRSQIVWVDSRSDRGMILDTVGAHPFSNFLVCDGAVDNPVGFVQTRDLFLAAMRHSELNPAILATPMIFVPDFTPVLKVLNRFRKEKAHIALVVDEYGATEGLITLTDVMEAIAGDLPDHGEDVEHPIVQRDSRSWIVDGTFPTDELQAVTGIPMEKPVEMLAGFILEHLGRIPEPGAGFDSGNAHFEVVRMDGNRIDKILVEILPESSDTEEPGD